MTRLTTLLGITVMSWCAVAEAAPPKDAEPLRVVRVTPQSAWHGKPLPVKAAPEGNDTFRIVRVFPAEAWQRFTVDVRLAAEQRGNEVFRLIRLVPEAYRNNKNDNKHRAQATPSPAGPRAS